MVVDVLVDKPFPSVLRKREERESEGGVFV